MSEELFERYLRNDLDEAGAKQLSELLATEEGARGFSEFAQEWTLLGGAARQRVEAAGPSGTRKIRRRLEAAPSRGWIGWAAAVAATVLFMIVLAVPGRPRIKEEKPVARTEPAVPVRVGDPTPPAPQEPERPPVARPAPSPVPPGEPVSPRVESPAPPVPPPAPKDIVSPSRPIDPEKVARPAVAVLSRIQGDVLVASPNGRRKASPGEGIVADESVETSGAASLAILDLPDLSRIELGPGALIERYQERQGRRSLALSRGTAVVTVTKQPAGRSVGLTTPHAEVTVLGTQFTLAVTADATRIEVTEGRVRLVRLPDGASIEVAAGHAALAAKGQKLESKLVVHTREFRDGGAYLGTRDTSISGAEPTRSFGSAEVLEVDGDEIDGKKIYGFLKWDLSELPPGAVIRSAVITLQVTNESLGTGYSFYEMKRSWSETEATWRQAAAGQPWRVAGARSSMDRGAEVLGTIAPRAKGAMAILILPAGEAVLQAWIRNPAANHGFIIANDANADGFKFASRKSPAADHRPKLTITYTLSAK